MTMRKSTAGYLRGLLEHGDKPVMLDKSDLQAAEDYGRELGHEEVAAWLAGGCPGLDRKQAVAFGPATMPLAIAEAIAAGAVRDFTAALKGETARRDALRPLLEAYQLLVPLEGDQFDVLSTLVQEAYDAGANSQ